MTFCLNAEIIRPENGIEIKVPLYISPGDFISVDTRSMEYQGRVNK